MRCRYEDEEEVEFVKSFDYKEVENAFASGAISLVSFAEVLADNFGKKKTRKILRRNLERSLIEEKIPLEEKQWYLDLVSSLV